MKKLIIFLAITACLVGCSMPSSYVDNLQKSSHAPGFEPERVYVEKIAKKLDSCILQNDPLEDFWGKMIVLPLESFIEFDDQWMGALEQKAEEYKTTILPKCEAIIRNGFTQIGVAPREKTYSLLRAELILVCMNDSAYEIARSHVFKELGKIMRDFYNPIYKKAELEANQNRESLSNALNKNQPFWKQYNLLYRYATEEQAKLNLRVELDRKYGPILDLKEKEWQKSITPKQENRLIRLQNSVQNAQNKEYYVKEFLKTLTPRQYAFLELTIYQQDFLELEKERMRFKERFSKFSRLKEWLEKNRNNAVTSYNNTLRQRQVQAAKTQALGMFLMGYASMMNTYTNWQNSYYNSYQIIGKTKYFQIYDQFGHYYQGLIY